MPKNNRSGRAALLSDTDFARIRKQLVNPKHRLFWDLARWTGERWGAICQLYVFDVYLDPYRSVPHEEITFRAVTRKASPSGERYTRQVPVHASLKEILQAYRPPMEAYLFPSATRPASPMTFQSAQDFLQRALDRAGLTGAGISTHSTRRTFITRLHRKGIDPVVLREITGHKDFQSLSHYIEVTPEQVKAAINVL